MIPDEGSNYQQYQIIMELFKTLNSILQSEDGITIYVQKRDNGTLVVSVNYNVKNVSSESKDLLQPFCSKGTPEQLDENFVNELSTPFETVNEYVSSVKEFESAAREAKKKLDEEIKKKAEEAKKKTKPASKDGKKKPETSPVENKPDESQTQNDEGNIFANVDDEQEQEDTAPQPETQPTPETEQGNDDNQSEEQKDNQEAQQEQQPKEQEHAPKQNEHSAKASPEATTADEQNETPEDQTQDTPSRTLKDVWGEYKLAKDKQDWQLAIKLLYEAREVDDKTNPKNAEVIEKNITYVESKLNA